MRNVFAAICAVTLMGGVAQAQTSLADIENALGGRASTLGRVEELLSDSDPHKRIAAMELLLESGDPQFIRKAREFGLLSDDHVLRQTALRAILTAGGAFRIEIAVSGKDSTDLSHATRSFEAAIDDTGRRILTFVLAEGVDSATGCWMSARGNCLLVATGDTIQLGNAWHVTNVGRLTGQFSLTDDGALAGHVVQQSRGDPGTPVAARIPLLD